MRPANGIQFASRDEARRNGYRACKICKPDGPDAISEVFLLTRYHSPLGAYIVVSSRQGVTCVAPAEESGARLDRWQRAGIVVREGESEHNLRLALELDEYFAGRLRRFQTPLDLRGTKFQRRVWELLLEIPYGETRTYRQLAQALGQPDAARAIGHANATNPIAIVVPCHRVIGSSGSLTGYAGGLHRKQALLDLESAANRSVILQEQQL